jgi:hypothetical protein
MHLRLWIQLIGWQYKGTILLSAYNRLFVAVVPRSSLPLFYSLRHHSHSSRFLSNISRVLVSGSACILLNLFLFHSLKLQHFTVFFRHINLGRSHSQPASDKVAALVQFPHYPMLRLRSLINMHSSRVN